MSFLCMVRDHVLSSFHILQEDVEYAPFSSIGDAFMFHKLFGNRAGELPEEQNEVLAA